MPDAAYLTASAAKTRDDRLKAFTDGEVTAQIASFEPIAERYLGAAQTPRTTTYTANGHRGTTFELPHVQVTAVSAVTLDGTALSSDQRATIVPNIARGSLYYPGGWCADTVTVAYTHGLAAVPAAVLDACTEYVVSVLTSRKSGASRNTLSVATDVGTTRYSTPDWGAGRPTGWLEVDRLLNSARDYRIMVA